MALLKFDLLFYLVTQLFDLWPRKAIAMVMRHGYIFESSLVIICQNLWSVSKKFQTDIHKHANHQINIFSKIDNFGNNEKAIEYGVFAEKIKTESKTQT